ncbi:MAG: putative glycoside hydrolase, partial [Acidimicrobiia bacterium]
GRDRLQPLGCAMSADVFGIIVSAGNDQGIGQRPEELSRHLDAFSPMVYPSHYSPGWLGFDDPNDHPYDVTTGAIEDAQRRIEDGVVLRPWLQSFWWTEEEIRRSIQAAEDHDVGWLLWNAVSNFSRAAIPTDAELTG